MEIFVIVVVILFAIVLASAFRVLREYERGVVFMLGRFQRVKGPGLIIIIPILQQMIRVTCAPSSWTCPRKTSSPRTTCR